MKKQSLTVDRIAIGMQTANHQTVMILNMKFDFSFEKLFAVTVIAPNGHQTVFCREMYPQEKMHSGQHFNTVQPCHKSRFKYREWKKYCNSILKNFHLDIEEVKDMKPCKKR